MIKKGIVALIIVLTFVFVVGCVDYKAYDLPAEEEAVNNEDSLVDEIAQIEKELAGEPVAKEEIVEETTKPETVEEEIVLPELTQEVSGEEVVITVKESDLVHLNVEVTDPDQDPVTWTFTSPINSMGEWQTDFGDAGDYLVTLSATDGKLTTEQKIKIVVQRVNVAPLIQTLKDITVAEGKVVTFEPKVTDPNGDGVTVTVSEPLANGEFATDHTSSGEYLITVNAGDGELSTEKTFTLTVTDVNELPVIEGVESTLSVNEGDVVKLKPVVTDLDGDELTVTISDPVGDDGIWETQFTDNGEYVVTITVDDTKNKVTKKVAITVEDVNMPPEIVDVSLK